VQCVDGTGAPSGSALNAGFAGYSGSVPAAATSGGQQCVTWSADNGGEEVLVRCYQAGVALQADAVALTAPGGSSKPNIVGVGGGFLIAYLFDVRVASYGVRLTPLDLSGHAGTPVDLTPKGSSPSGLALASSGDQALITWLSVDPVANADLIEGQRVGPDGTPLDPQPRALFSPSDAPFNKTLGVASPSVAFNGTDYLVAWEVDGDDAGPGDLWFRAVHPDGTPTPIRVLADDRTAEQQPSLASATPGRVLLSYVEYEPAPLADALRVRTRIIASVPAGYPCSDMNECQSGICAAGVCCASADGGCTPAVPPDAGPLSADAGQGRMLHVGCGCGASPGGASLAWLASAVLVLLRGIRPAVARAGAPRSRGL
jgi:hypothetical protein